MSKKVTIEKLAKKLSLSKATVQRALASNQNVHPETRRRVLKAAQKDGYMRHGHGKRNIAILVASYQFSGYPDRLLRYLEKEFHRRGFMVELIPLKDIDLLGNYMFDGILSLVWKKGLEKTLPQKYSVPIITINAASNILESVPVIMSDPHGIRIALDYLHNRGCRRIFFLSTREKDTPDADSRLEEFRRFCLETGQDYETMHLKLFSNEIKKNLPLILKNAPDACFCASERYAARVGLQLKKAGLRIPEDISLMGLESNLVNECFMPPITAIRQNFEQIAETAAESMYQAVVNGIPPTCATIPFQLIERESVRQPQ